MKALFVPAILGILAMMVLCLGDFIVAGMQRGPSVVSIVGLIIGLATVVYVAGFVVWAIITDARLL